jgi:hypothetical protein
MLNKNTMTDKVKAWSLNPVDLNRQVHASIWQLAYVLHMKHAKRHRQVAQTMYILRNQYKV